MRALHAGYEQIKGNGVEAYLAKVYAGDGVVFNFTTETVGNLTYDFSLTCDVAADRGGKEGTEAFAGRISAIKRHVLASCFFYYFESVSANAAAVQVRPHATAACAIATNITKRPRDTAHDAHPPHLSCLSRQ